MVYLLAVLEKNTTKIAGLGHSLLAGLLILMAELELQSTRGVAENVTSLRSRLLP